MGYFFCPSVNRAARLWRVIESGLSGVATSGASVRCHDDCYSPETVECNGQLSVFIPSTLFYEKSPSRLQWQLALERHLVLKCS